MLSFELCWDGSPVVVDTGTSTYEIGPRRTLERGTSAHNTVQIGALEQTEIWAGFRVARRAKLLEVAVHEESVSARIRAFPRAWSELERSWTFDGETLELRDRVLETPRRDLLHTARLHFHPDVALVGEGARWTANGLGFRFQGAGTVRNVEYLYAPEFNRRIPARCLEIEFEGELVTVVGP
jgi:hypothetical protein